MLFYCFISFILSFFSYLSFFFFFNDTAPTEIYTLSLHDALPICVPSKSKKAPMSGPSGPASISASRARRRSEEHTSELQSHVNLVCRLLLEKKKKKTNKTQDNKKNKDKIIRYNILHTLFRHCSPK